MACPPGRARRVCLWFHRSDHDRRRGRQNPFQQFGALLVVVANSPHVVETSRVTGTRDETRTGDPEGINTAACGNAFVTIGDMIPPGLIMREPLEQSSSKH